MTTRLQPQGPVRKGSTRAGQAPGHSWSLGESGDHSRYPGACDVELDEPDVLEVGLCCDPLVGHHGGREGMELTGSSLGGWRLEQVTLGVWGVLRQVVQGVFGGQAVGKSAEGLHLHHSSSAAARGEAWSVPLYPPLSPSPGAGLCEGMPKGDPKDSRAGRGRLAGHRGTSGQQDGQDPAGAAVTSPRGQGDTHPERDGPPVAKARGKLRTPETVWGIHSPHIGTDDLKARR